MAIKANPGRRKSRSKTGAKIGGVIFGAIFAIAGLSAAIGIASANDPELSMAMQILMALFFLLTFGGVGCAFIWFSLKGRNHKANLEEIAAQGIFSDQKSAHKVFYIVSAIFSFPGLMIAAAGIAETKAFGFASLLFFLISFVLYRLGLKSKSTYEAIGPTPIKLDPLPATIGQQLGGEFPLTARPRNGLTLRLSCLHTYSSGSGDNRSTHTDVIYQQESKAFIDTDAFGRQSVKFLFDIPADKPESDNQGYRGTISWQLKATGQVTTDRKVPGTQIAELMEFSRSWKIPVLLQAEARGLGFEAKSSTIAIPLQHREESRREQALEAQQSAARQIDMEVQGDGSTSIVSEAGRNRAMWGMLLVFGAIFGSVGIFLFYLATQEGGGLWLMAPIFASVGWGLFFFAIFLAGRKLEATIREGHVQIIRSLFGRQLYQRNGRISSPSQLSLEVTMSSTSQDQVKTDYMAVYANIDGKKIKLAEGIEGRQAGEAMMAKIKAALTSNLDSELA